MSRESWSTMGPHDPLRNAMATIPKANPDGSSSGFDHDVAGTVSVYDGQTHVFDIPLNKLTPENSVALAGKQDIADRLKTAAVITASEGVEPPSTAVPVFSEIPLAISPQPVQGVHEMSGLAGKPFSPYKAPHLEVNVQEQEKERDRVLAGLSQLSNQVAILVEKISTNSIAPKDRAPLPTHRSRTQGDEETPDFDLDIPFLAGPRPVRPTVTVTFDMPTGQTVAKYHAVLCEESTVVLVYDKRFEHGAIYTPPESNPEQPVAIGLSAKSREGEFAENVYNFGFGFELGVLTFTVLIKA